MKRIPAGFIVPSACLTVPPKLLRGYELLEKRPEVGDVMYGRITYLGQHSSLENKQGRIHLINDGTRAVFVYGNRYASDAFEGFVPSESQQQVDLLARSGIIGVMREKNAQIKDPTRVKILGNVLDSDGQPLNTRRFSIADPRHSPNGDKKRAKMILVIGTSMNSGKSTAALACCRALSAMGYAVRAAKITGTASLKDILHMQDGGAHRVADFSYLGFPSTYMLDPAEVLGVFTRLDGRYGNNPANYWIVELADGILQRETALLLESPIVRRRVHKLVFAASDALGAIGGLGVLRERFVLVPDAISGLCSSSPLGMRELRDFTQIPVFNSVDLNLKELAEILI